VIKTEQITYLAGSWHPAGMEAKIILYDLAGYS
jgi:hypothetical protein